MADLNFLNVDTTCTGIEISTPTVGKAYLEYIGGVTVKDFSSIKSYKIKYSTNCCTETEIILPVWYNISLSTYPVDPHCVDNGDGTISFDIVISGIDKELIDDTSLEYSLDDVTYIATSFENYTEATYRVTVPDPGVYPALFDLYLKFKNLDGYEYKVYEEFGMTLSACDLYDNDQEVITYPTLPTNVVIDPITGYLDFNTLIATDPALSGVYQVIVCEETFTTEACIQNHYFFECDVKCDVINKLVQCKDSDILFFYDALRYSNDCTANITYSEVCAIYELMIYKITSSGCYSPWDDCNCSGTTDIYTQNNNSRTTVRNCGCNG